MESDPHGMMRLQGRGHLVRQYAATRHIYHRRQINKTMRHRNIGGIQRPYLIGLGDGDVAQQIGINGMPRTPPAGARLRDDGLNAHPFHQRADMASADQQAVFRQLPLEHTCAHEWMQQMQFIKTAHELKIGFADRSGRVVHPTTADIEQASLGGDG